MKRSGINDIFGLLRPAAVSRFKFAVLSVGNMCNKRYRRLQYDNTDSEFCDLGKPNIRKSTAFGQWISVCRKTSSLSKMGCRALLALLVLHRAKLLASNQSVLALGDSPRTGRQPFVPLHRAVAQMADYKHPCLD